jgi:uncharacterized integral membrane protein
MDQQEFTSGPLLRSSEVQSQDGQALFANEEEDVQFCNQSQQSEVKDVASNDLPSTCENSLPQDSDQTALMQKPNSEQDTQWQQDVDLLPGLGTINDKEIDMEQIEKLMQKEYISIWVGLLLLLLVLGITILLVYSAGIALVRVLFVISLLPLILAFGSVVIFLVIALLRLLHTRIRQQKCRR